MLPHFEFTFFPTSALESLFFKWFGRAGGWVTVSADWDVHDQMFPVYVLFNPALLRLNVTLFFHPPFPPCRIPNIRGTLHVDKCSFIHTSQYIFLVVRVYCLPSSFIHIAGGWNKGSCKYILDRSNGVPLPLPNLRDAASAKTSSWWAGHEEYIQPWCGW